jgi:hypothetical protein
MPSTSAPPSRRLKFEVMAGLDLDKAGINWAMRRFACARAGVFCRVYPLAGAIGTRAAEIGCGLAAGRSGFGWLIAFSTQPGKVALDGGGPRRRSPPTSASLAAPGQDLSSGQIAVRNKCATRRDEAKA